MDELARITALWRYPVKSLQGEPVDTFALRPGGVAGDRALGVVDDETGRVLSAKTVPELLRAAARTDDGDAVVVTLPDGTELGAADPTTSAALSAWLDRPVHLAAADEAPAAGTR